MTGRPQARRARFGGKEQPAIRSTVFGGDKTGSISDMGQARQRRGRQPLGSADGTFKRRCNQILCFARLAPYFCHQFAKIRRLPRCYPELATRLPDIVETVTAPPRFRVAARDLHKGSAHGDWNREVVQPDQRLWIH